MTLSVLLRDASRRIERNGSQHASKRCKAPWRIYRLPHLPPTLSTWILAGWLASWLAGWLFHGFSLILMVFQGSGVIIIMMLHNLRHPNVQPAAPTETFPPSWLAGWLAGWLVVGWLAGWLAFSWIFFDFYGFSRIGCHNAPGPFIQHPKAP